MTRTVEVRSGAYRDSVGLMQISTQLRTLSGVEAALVAMATELNVELLDSMGFDRPASTSPNDMLVAIEAADDDAVAEALRVLESALVAAPSPGGGDTDVPPPTILAAARRSPPGWRSSAHPARWRRSTPPTRWAPDST